MRDGKPQRGRCAHRRLIRFSLFCFSCFSLLLLFRFAPFFALYEKRGMVVQGIFLFVFGPMLAGWISPNLMEQASIWCFFSIAQIAIMLFCIRETLITNWGKDKTHSSLLTGQGGKGKVAPKDEAAEERVTRGSSKKKSKHAE